ncbi:MAG: hypothetical protein MUO87_04760 [Thermoplasmata archaeon]|jgi:hypothetical protein|nr:hypothetical protein [Thermoplasmata archaeon]
MLVKEKIVEFYEAQKSRETYVQTITDRGDEQERTRTEEGTVVVMID